MGLDVTAMSKIAIDKVDGEPSLYSVGFPQSNMEKFEDEPITYEQAHSFRAGSYSGYNAMRRELCELINGIPPEVLWAHEDGPEWHKKPFYWLINFSDCEGYIGTDYCKILLKDCEDHWDTIQIKGSDYLKDVMNDFRKAFELGADDGVVKFH